MYVTGYNYVLAKIAQYSRCKIILCFDRSSNILRTNTRFMDGVDSTSRDEILTLKSHCSKLSLSSKSGLFSDTYLQTTFAGFFISNIFSPITAFSLGLSSPFNFENYPTEIPFDIINIDTHKGWNRFSNAYIVQVTGVYVISLTVTSLAREFPFVQLQINSETFVGLHFGSNNTNGIETLSRTVLLSLNE